MSEAEFAGLRVKLAKSCYDLISEPDFDFSFRKNLSEHPSQAVIDVILADGLLSYFASYGSINGMLFEPGKETAYREWVEINKRELLIRDKLYSILNNQTIKKINPILLRGVSWQRYYTDSFVRDMADIDLLIMDDDQNRFERALRENGWEPYNVQRNVMYKDGVTLDIHTAVMGEDNRRTREYAGEISAAQLFQNSTNIEINSENVRVLDEVDDLICNTIHWVKHSFDKMSRGVDIAMICKWITSQDRWDEVIDRVKEFRVHKLFSYGISPISKIFGCSIPRELLLDAASSKSSLIAGRIIYRISSGLETRHAGIVLYGQAIDSFWKRMKYFSEVVFPSRDYRCELMDIHGSSSLTAVMLSRFAKAGTEMLKLCYRLLFRS